MYQKKQTKILLIFFTIQVLLPLAIQMLFNKERLNKFRNVCGVDNKLPVETNLAGTRPSYGVRTECSLF